uniref:Uncharacterized protein n=1 Tax=Acrobeloides nanus TaxID=290746 RepID=A0A914DGN2_9BILA
MSEPNDKEPQGTEENNNGLLQNITDLVKAIVPMLENLNESGPSKETEESKISRIQRIVSVIHGDPYLTKTIFGINGPCSKKPEETTQEETRQNENPVNNLVNQVEEAMKHMKDSGKSFNMTQYRERRDRAKLAKYIDEHPSLIIALNEAADIFEEAKCNCLNKKVRHYKSKVKDGQDINAFVEVVLEGIRNLPIPGLEALLNFGNIASAIADCVKCCMQSEKICGKAHEKYTQPIISDTHVAWVKYEFTTEQVATKKCIFKKRYVEVDSIATFFCFPNQDEFRYSLSRAFHVVREQRAMNEMKKRNEMNE